MADKTADAHQFLLRLPKPLRNRLLAQAKRNNVSLNTEIVNQLEGYDKRTTEIVHEAVRASATITAEVVQSALPKALEEAMERQGFKIARLPKKRGKQDEQK